MGAKETIVVILLLLFGSLLLVKATQLVTQLGEPNYALILTPIIFAISLLLLLGVRY